MAYLEYGCGPLPDAGLISCGNFKRGAISAIGILDESAFGSGGLDFQTDADWSNSAKYIQSINAGRLAIIAKIRANVPDASPNDVDNPVGCGPQSITTAYDFTVSWMDANTTSATIDFYGQLNKRVAGLILFIPASDEVYVITSPTNFVCNPINVPSSNRELQKFNCIARTTFAPDSLPRKFYAPSNSDQIFQSCYYPTLGPTPAVGSQMEGGYVFYVDNALRVAYVMSSEPIGGANYNQAPNLYPWADPSFNIAAVGFTTPNSFKASSSASNTSIIVAATTGGQTNAANACDSLSLNGYSDWALPSSLNTNVPSEFGAWYYMANNLLSVVLTYPGNYWTSNQQNSTSGQLVSVGINVSQSSTNKIALSSVWPIRSFSY